MKIYKVKRYTAFPKQKDNDRVIRTVDNLKSAQRISIELNNTLNSRFYVETVEVV